MARVLIVDDSAVARKKLIEIMQELGHKVVAEAANGAQAFAEYVKHKPDVVTMDMTMEGISGAETISKIIAGYPEARIIVISAIEERPVILDSLERGARHFIIKPITASKVAEVVGNVLNQKLDYQKHLELVRRLTGTAGPDERLKTAGEVRLPPYQIFRDGKVVQIAIYPALSPVSCQSLLIELQEHLEEEPRLLLNFGATASLKKEVLAVLDRLVQAIETKGGIVKGIAHDLEFTEDLAGQGHAFLSAVVRHFPGNSRGGENYK